MLIGILLLILAFYLPYRYQSLGCHDIFPYYSKLKHEQHCRFCPYNCPYAGFECSITGDIPALVTHLKDDHNVDMHDGCTFNHRYVKANPHEVENSTWMLTSCCVVVKNMQRCIYAIPNGYMFQNDTVTKLERDVEESKISPTTFCTKLHVIFLILSVYRY